MLGKNIKHHRIKHQWSQKVLAEKLYVSPSTISNWERDEFEPSAELIEALAKLFGVTPNALFGHEDNTKMETSKTYQMREVSLDTSIKQRSLVVYFFVMSGLLMMFTRPLFEALWMLGIVLLIVIEVLGASSRSTRHYREVRILGDKRLVWHQTASMKFAKASWIFWLSMGYLLGLFKIIFITLILTTNAPTQWTFLGGLVVTFTLLWLSYLLTAIPWLMKAGQYSLKNVHRFAPLAFTRVFVYFDLGFLTVFSIRFFVDHPEPRPPFAWIAYLLLVFKMLVTFVLREKTKESIKTLSLEHETIPTNA